METRLHLHINWSGAVGGYSDYYVLRDWSQFFQILLDRAANEQTRNPPGEPNYKAPPKPRVVVYDFK